MAGVVPGSSPAAVRAASRSSVRVSRAASKLSPSAAAPHAARPISLAVVLFGMVIFTNCAFLKIKYAHFVNSSSKK